MSQWFSGVGPLTPSSPAQAASLLLEGVIKEHEANNPSDVQTSPASSGRNFNPTHYKSAYPLIQSSPTETVCHLCFFPSGVHREVFKCYRLFSHQFLPERGLLAFAFSSAREEYTKAARLEVYENGSKIAGVVLREKINCIGLESRDRIALGHEGHVDIFDRQKDTYGMTEELKMPRHSPVILNFSGEVLLIGTKFGGVFGYNVRKGQFSWSFQAEGRGRVHDLQMKKGIVYVSGSGGLWMWDMRGTDKIRREFLGHRTRGKRLLFDTSSELGLLAGGGDDGIVRLWNCRSGEDPVGELVVPNEMPVSVKFVREDYDGKECLGMWIATRRKLLTCVVEPNEFYDLTGIPAP